MAIYLDVGRFPPPRSSHGRLKKTRRGATSHEALRRTFCKGLDGMMFAARTPGVTSQLKQPETETGDPTMPRGDKSKYSDKQKRKAQHIEDSYEERGVPKEEAESRAWATVNKESGGGNKSGSGRGKADTNVSSKIGGRKGGAAARTAEERSASARKAAATRKRKRNQAANAKS
jgi:plasmid stabilization system protein ParE